MYLHKHPEKVTSNGGNRNYEDQQIHKSTTSGSQVDIPNRSQHVLWKPGLFSENAIFRLLKGPGIKLLFLMGDLDEKCIFGQTDKYSCNRISVLLSAVADGMGGALEN